MRAKKVFSTILGVVALSALVVCADTPMIEQAARELAKSVVLSELQSTMHVKPNQFLHVERDEELEESLALAARGHAGSMFIYKISPTGYEIKGNSVVYHTWSDFDIVFIVVVNASETGTYRIHGFGLAESLAEFNRLMTGLGMRISDADEAESVADFYQRVNPENEQALRPILYLMDLKQAAEWQCQSGAKSFTDGEQRFATWWKQKEAEYANLSLKETAAPHGDGYLVTWPVLSRARSQRRVRRCSLACTAGSRRGRSGRSAYLQDSAIEVTDNENRHDRARSEQLGKWRTLSVFLICHCLGVTHL